MNLLMQHKTTLTRVLALDPGYDRLGVPRMWVRRRRW